MDRLRISLLFCADDLYFQPMAATIASLLRANPVHDFQIFVCSQKKDPQEEERLSSVVSRFRGAAITFLQFDLTPYSFLQGHRHLTLAAYLRLFITEFLDPGIEKILYLDCDLIVSADIGELWQTDLKDAFVAAAPDPYIVNAHLGFGPHDVYFNSGVMLIDVTRWRSVNVFPAFLKFAEENAVVLNCADQDVLNHVFRGKVRFLDYRWNFQSFFADGQPEDLKMSADAFQHVRRSPPIVHFTTKFKPWIYSHHPHYTRLYSEALALTPWGKERPPDRTLKSMLLKFLKMKVLKERVRWYAPGLVRFFRRVSAR